MESNECNKKNLWKTEHCVLSVAVISGLASVPVWWQTAQ